MQIYLRMDIHSTTHANSRPQIHAHTHILLHPSVHTHIRHSLQDKVSQKIQGLLNAIKYFSAVKKEEKKKGKI